MRRLFRPAVASGVAAVLVMSLAACAPEEGETGPTPTVAPTATQTASPTPDPVERAVVISVDGVTVDDGATVAYSDRDAVVALLTETIGADPTQEPVEGPYGAEYTSWVWDGLQATDDGSRITLMATADAPLVSFTTPEGIGLGSTRAEALAAGAEDEWDEDGDGIADYLKIGMRQAEGTESLVHPGQVGVEYVLLTITDDVVTKIHSGANDFSDI